jgi:hypothetical protein
LGIEIKDHRGWRIAAAERQPRPDASPEADPPGAEQLFPERPVAVGALEAPCMPRRTKFETDVSGADAAL